jgi:hypothetical protein
MNTAATWVEVVGIIVFFVALIWLARQASRSGIVRRLPRQPLQIAPGPGPSPALDPAPVSYLEPVRVPLVIVLGDFNWKNQDMGKDMVKAMLQVARNYGELETVRELAAARRVVKGELAS